MGKKTAYNLTETKCKQLPKPDTGNRLYFDKKGNGLALRVTAAGSRSFVVCYRVDGRERRKTIGRFDDWSPALARDEAREIYTDAKRRESPVDPLAEEKARREAYTLKQWSDIYIKEHAKPEKRPSSVKADQRHIRMLLKHFGESIKLADIKRPDIRRYHRSMKDKPRQANKVLATLSHMFTCAKSDEIEGISENPVSGIKRFPEESRKRFLHGKELESFVHALQQLTAETRAIVEDAARLEHKRIWNLNTRKLTQYRLIEFLLLTGARIGETQEARWHEIDFERGVWTKPSHHTKQKQEERVPLSAAARLLLTTWVDEPKRCKNSDLIFPGSRPGVSVDYPRDTWKALLSKSEINNLRIHDLRHSYASALVMSGQSLPIVGRLMGHTTPATTAQYAHLADDPLRKATEVMGGLMTGMANGKKAEVVELKERAQK